MSVFNRSESLRLLFRVAVAILEKSTRWRRVITEWITSDQLLTVTIELKGYISK